MTEEKNVRLYGSNYNFYDISFIILRRAMRNNEKIPLLFVSKILL